MRRRKRVQKQLVLFIGRGALYLPRALSGWRAGHVRWRGEELKIALSRSPFSGRSHQLRRALVFNLYMHYAFDTWMARHFPDTSFVRYADDGLVHCKSEAEARRLQEAIGARLMACGLELHPEKTRIVYCRDGNRKNDYSNTSFDFLGYTFRGRLAKSKRGVYFNSFSPALSGKAAKRIRERMRMWDIGRWTDAGIEDIAARANPALRGWWNYYAAFYMS
jgi:RNA-directed DNA polymerase